MCVCRAQCSLSLSRLVYQVAYDFTVHKFADEEGMRSGSGAEDGAFVHGLFLEGAGCVALSDLFLEVESPCYVTLLRVVFVSHSWNDDALELMDSRPKELFLPMPIVHLLPRKSADIETGHTYSCPVYKTSARRGQLSTTGHSTNFVMVRSVPHVLPPTPPFTSLCLVLVPPLTQMIELPMNEKHTSKKWIKVGVAMLTQLDS